jgi:hypothetical protein
MKTRKILALILASLLIIGAVSVLAACGSSSKDTNADAAAQQPENTQQTGDETPQPTEPAQQTEVPETEAPGTEAPETEPPETDYPEPVIPDDYYYQLLEKNVPVKCDIDFDGLEDEITFVVENDEVYTVRIVLGSDPGNPYTDTFPEEDVYYGICFINDSDRYDGRMEVICSYEFSSDDVEARAYRVNEDGRTIECFAKYGYIEPIDDDGLIYARDGQFYVYCRTEIFGTNSVYNLFQITEDGFEEQGAAYYFNEYYDDDGTQIGVCAISDFTVILVDDNGDPQGEATVREGSDIYPVETDLESYAIVRLEDGSYARIDIELVDDWHPYINGQPQEELLSIIYAD